MRTGGPTLTEAAEVNENMGMKPILILVASFLVLPCMVRAEEVAVIKRAGAGWKVWNQKEAPPEAWTAIDFDDAAWEDATMPLGYGKEPVATKLGFGEDEKQKRPVVHLRQGFELKEVAEGYVFKIRVDDGAVVYVNGKEVKRLYVRNELKQGEYSGYLRGPGVIENYAVLLMEPEHVQVGKNVLALSLHQGSADSSDLYMDLELTAVDKEILEVLEKQAAEQQKLQEEAEKKAEEAKKKALEENSPQA